VRAPDLCEAAGISYRQCDFWVRRGYLKPYGGVGTGSVRDFPQSEVFVARHMAELLRAGVRLVTAHDIARGSITATQALRKALEATG
jgi:MerR HTH family regulatory protein